MDQQLIEILEGYERDGWVLLALPPDVAAGVVGVPATNQTAMALSARIKAKMDALDVATPR